MPRNSGDWPRRALYVEWTPYSTTHRQRSLVGVTTLDNPEANVYWGITEAQHATVSSFYDMVILKDYGTFADEREVIEAEVWRQNDFDYPPVSFDMNSVTPENIPRYGLLSPDGILYPCERNGHSGLSEHLLEVVLNTSDDDMPYTNFEDALRKQKWARLDWGGFFTDDSTYTQPQQEVIAAYLAITETVDPDWTKRVRDRYNWRLRMMSEFPDRPLSEPKKDDS